MKRVTYVCPECGEPVNSQAEMKWNDKRQEWEYFDSGEVTCFACDWEGSLEEAKKELK
jgi:predicted RNA-binding Zn-ribbon protein involved in translation (DUF1610 family)